MDNLQIAKTFREIAAYLDVDDVPFKPQAYRKAARSIEVLPDDLAFIYHQKGLKGLEAIPGVGKAIAEKMAELIDTGKLKYLDKLQKQIPVKMIELTAIEGVGPKMVKKLYQELDIKNIKQLERAAKQHKIQKLEGFREKTEQNILTGIEFLKQTEGRFLLGDVLPVARRLRDSLATMAEVKKIEIGGSVRRRQETIGDIDILTVSSKPLKVMKLFTGMPEVVHIYGQGPTRGSVRLENGIDCDLRIVPAKSYGAALQYFTGNKEHNIVTRKIAIKKKLKLNEYGVFRGNKLLAGKTEEEVYKAIGLKVMPPEIRTNRGEIEAAKKDKLPKLIGYKGMAGDLQMHTNWSDAQNSIEEMAQEARKIGYQYIGLTDHTQSPGVARGMDEKGLIKYMAAIEEADKEIKGIKIFKSAEVNIMKGGTLDIKDNTLKKLDYVTAGVHNNFNMPKAEMTKRIIKAVSHPLVNILVHPTGRLINRRPGYQLDLDAVIKACIKNKVAIEINAQPARLDLSDINARKARDMGAKLVINTDAHDINQLHLMEYGVATARRGWIEKKDVINTKPITQLLKFFNK
ncbi:DNA polymerase/3'-5' exonuclease PolX [Patescibacteria group bacterium]|nr:DNA polymerase/3'-5' exonuclease PolX [Patescibacteria group bacterium]MBU1672920.1 DNA polymerase/3'-5' exonuclease PolX [Patescibacteria group bacterium]MBU1963391.1 DNA polymerase/3'-5' exonuclease PolX [Patescibacteria group bacterium]